jgi:hypothetical protein
MSSAPDADSVRRWRWRWPTALVLGILTAGVVIGLLQPSSSGYLDPNSTDPQGGHALADLLTNRGQQVIRTTTPGTDGDLVLVTSPDRLTSGQLTQLARFRGDLVITDPDAAALAALAPAVRLAGQGPGAAVPPRCAAQSAVLAGDADVGGTLLRTSDPAAETCYPNGGGYSLIEYTDGSRVISVLGSSTPLTNGGLTNGGLTNGGLTNGGLTDRGNAALALNLLRTGHRVSWLVPTGSPGVTATGNGQRSFFSLVPEPVYLVAIQLGVAIVLAAAWRARRLGPVVPEQLPVIVRASETVEGHGRLYQARRARDSAAESLRAATRQRLSRVTGISDISVASGTEMTPNSRDFRGYSNENHGSLPGGAIVVASRTKRDPAAVKDLLYGPPPPTDAALVTLASDLDTLEREVLLP